MAQTAVELVINEIDQQQKRYIDLAKKDKAIKKEVDAILTATTLLKMKCEQAKELEKQQIIDFTNWVLLGKITQFENKPTETIEEFKKNYNHGTGRK